MRSTLSQSEPAASKDGERRVERKNENVEGAEWTVKEEVKRKEQRRGGEREESGREGEREGGKEGSGLR